jgi:RNase P subunit RPR2
VQKFFRFLLPEATFRRIKDESSQWSMVCDECGFSISYWDAGGLRTGSASSRKRVLGRCPTCGCFRFFSVIKRGLGA